MKYKKCHCVNRNRTKKNTRHLLGIKCLQKNDCGNNTYYFPNITYSEPFYEIIKINMFKKRLFNLLDERYANENNYRNKKY